jgi:hypothetical protein
VFFVTSGLPKSADAFFTQVAQEKASEAYQSTATEFQAGTSEQEFMQFLQATSLRDYQSASWSSRSIENDRGYLEGTVATKSGGKVPLRLEFIKEGGAWKIYAIHKPTGGLTEAQSDVVEKTPTRPSDDDAKRLAHNTLVSFHEAVKAKDFNAFYEDISPLWQRQTSVADLQSNFRPFTDADADLFGVVSAPLEWTEAPSLDGQNLLVLRGQAPKVPDESSALAFELKYHSDGGEWKLVGIHVEVP